MVQNIYLYFFSGQSNQYPYNMMQQNQQGQQRPGNYVGNQMAMRAQGQQQSGYPMGGQPRVPNPGQPSPNFMSGNNQPGPQAGYRPQMGGKDFENFTNNNKKISSNHSLLEMILHPVRAPF